MINGYEITRDMLDGLRERVKNALGEKRFSHTLGVEREIERLARIYCPDKAVMLRAAALLHDITKEYSTERQLEIMEKYGIHTSEYSGQSPKIYHSITAALIIPREYSEFAYPELMLAVHGHTTGRADMSLSDKLLYLADYIEETRTFEDCVTLRKYFWDGIEAGEDKQEHLNKTLLKSFDMTLCDLIENGNVISQTTIEARNFLIGEIK